MTQQMNQFGRTARSIRTVFRCWRQICICAFITLSVLVPLRVAACADDRVEIRGAWGTAQFHVEIADRDDTRMQGLMHRDHLPQMQGMLFLFEEIGPKSFWMKNTNIPLDMIFIDDRGQVLHVHSRAIPHDQTPIIHNGDVLAVLEINGGLSEMFGIDSDSLIRHPRLDQGIALWPCNG
ncbi:MAG: DUF192 domain-containing protein [Rhodobacteraceae bacterium]|nr:DUF192 domain-containing protein [Paracoccaceae bacterium]